MRNENSDVNQESVEFTFNSPSKQSYDISVEMTWEVVRALMREAHLRLFDTDTASFDKFTLKLLKMIKEQANTNEHLIKKEQSMVYDFEFTFADYSTFSNVVSEVVKARMNVYDREFIVDIFVAWVDVTQQIMEQDDDFDDNMVSHLIEELYTLQSHE